MEHFRVNTIGPIHLFNAFMPLILRGVEKKIFAISTGAADTEMTLKADMYQATAYSITKAALNMAVAKFSAVYREKGVLVMAICPGAVATNGLQIGGLSQKLEVDCHRVECANLCMNLESEEDGKLTMAMFANFKQYSPTFEGPGPMEDSAKSVLGLMHKATVDGGYAGTFMSNTEKKSYL